MVVRCEEDADINELADDSVLHITMTLTVQFQSPRGAKTILRTQHAYGLYNDACLFFFSQQSFSMIDDSIFNILLGFVNFSVE